MQAAENLVTSSSNARVKQLRGALAGHPRLSGGLIALEGEHLVEEALRSGLVLKTVFLGSNRDLPACVPSRVEVLRLSDELFASVAETRSPQGIAALAVPPTWTLDQALSGVPLVLVAAGLQDPGNLGTLIRSTEAFGGSGVLTMPGTVGAWNGKALRASAGSVFRMPVLPCTPEQLSELRREGLRLIAGVGEGVGTEQIVEIHDVDLTAGIALLIGNEGAGLSPELLAVADTRVTIPCTGTVESLNAAIAGSILLYEAQRQRSRVGVPQHAGDATR